MTTHNQDDAKRLEQIERLLRDGTPSDDAIANLLRRNIPKPHPQHTESLEQELFPMNMNSSEKRKIRPSRLPLAAAAVAAVLLSSAAIFGLALRGGDNYTINSSDSRDDFSLTATPLIPEPTQIYEATPFYTVVPPLAQGQDFDPFLLTATAYVAEVTQTYEAAFGVNSATLVPTATPLAVEMFSATGIPATNLQGNVIALPQDQTLRADGITDSLPLGTRLAITMQIVPLSPQDTPSVLLTDEAVIVNMAENGDYLVYVPSDIAPILSWLVRTSTELDSTLYVVDVVTD